MRKTLNIIPVILILQLIVLLATNTLHGDTRHAQDKFATTGVVMLPPPLSGTEDTIGSSHFLIHYTKSGKDSTTDQWADSVLSAAETSRLVDSLKGWLLPWSPHQLGRGGRYDIYINDTSKIWGGGVTVLLEPYPLDTSTWRTAVMIYRDSTPGYAMSKYDFVRVDVAHEYHHAIQYSYRYWLDAYVGEATAVYMEEVVYPNFHSIRDRLRELYPTTLNNPNLALDDKSGGIGYTDALWNIFLGKKYGPNIVRQIWEKFSQNRLLTYLEATDSVLIQLYGSRIDSCYRDYAIWRYFTGPRADTAKYFPDGMNYPASFVYTTNSQYPITSATGPSSIDTGKIWKRGGTAYVCFTNGASGLNVQQVCSQDSTMKSIEIKYNTITQGTVRNFSLSTTTDTLISSFGVNDTIVMVVVNVDNSSIVSWPDFTYSAQLYAANGEELYAVQFINQLHNSTNAGGQLLAWSQDRTIDSTVNSGGYINFEQSVFDSARTLSERFTPPNDSIYKHQYWNSDYSDYSITHEFSVDPNHRMQVAQFTGLNPVTIRNELVDAPQLDDGTIGFQDPWYVDASYRQMDSMLSYNSPLIPPGSYNKPPSGTFLNQLLSSGHFYSVQANPTITIDGYQNNEFLSWGSTGKTSVSTPSNLTTKVVFGKAHDTIKARYKGHLITSDTLATVYGGARKIAATLFATHMVYESGGGIFYTRNTGSGWGTEQALWLSASAKNPSVDAYHQGVGQDYVHVCWEDTGTLSGDSVVSHIVYYTRSTDG